MNQSDSISIEQETAVESSDNVESEEFFHREIEFNYATQNPSTGVATSGKFTLTFNDGAVMGRRVKLAHNGAPVNPPEHSTVEGYYLKGRLKLYREIPASRVVQIYDLRENQTSGFEGKYYNIGGNDDAGTISLSR